MKVLYFLGIINNFRHGNGTENNTLRFEVSFDLDIGGDRIDIV